MGRNYQPQLVSLPDFPQGHRGFAKRLQELGNETREWVPHVGKLTAGTLTDGGLVQMLFLFNWVIFRFHVNFPG